MDHTDQNLTPMRNILLGWSNLSRGDISIICLAIRNPHPVQTVGGTAQALFWHNVVALGWAEQLYSIIDPADVDFEPLSFALTGEGVYRLARFLVSFDLLNMGVCSPAADFKRPQTTSARTDRTPSARRPFMRLWLAIIVIQISILCGMLIRF
jgi:hypothetical protein